METNNNFIISPANLLSFRFIEDSLEKGETANAYIDIDKAPKYIIDKLDSYKKEYPEKFTYLNTGYAIPDKDLSGHPTIKEYPTEEAFNKLEVYSFLHAGETIRTKLYKFVTDSLDIYNDAKDKIDIIYVPVDQPLPEMTFNVFKIDEEAENKSVKIDVDIEDDHSQFADSELRPKEKSLEDLSYDEI